MNLLMKCIESVLLQLNKKYVIDPDSLRIADEAHLIPFLCLTVDSTTEDKIKEFLRDKLNAYLLYDSMQKEELKAIKALFNENRIAFAILKGERLQCLYPDSFLRFMGDFDILVNKSDLKLVGSLLEARGYTKVAVTNHDITYGKKPFDVEMHYKLIPEKIFGSSYFNDPFTLMENINHSEYVFKKKEDEYIYYLFHLLRHYETSGIGLRNFIDLYLFKRNNTLDMKYIEEAYKCTSFKEDCIYLDSFINEFFNKDSLHEDLIFKILNNKTFGSTQELTKNELKNKSTFRWLLRRMFPTITQMKNYYKCLNKKIGCILLPFLYIHHIFYFGIVKFKYSINRIKLAKKIKKEE